MAHPAIAAGRVAVVTGAALGIGRALTKRLVEEGMRVAMLDVDVEHLHEARDAAGGETEAILCDVAEIESLEHARERIIADWGEPPSLLVKREMRLNRAGVLYDANRAPSVAKLGLNTIDRSPISTLVSTSESTTWATPTTSPSRMPSRKRA